MSAQPRSDALAVAVAAATDAGKLLAEAFAGGPASLIGRRHEADTKTAEFDLVTEYDRRSEALLVARLAAAFPRDAVVAEEGGGHDGVDRTAPPSGGAAGRGQAPTVDPTAPPSGGAAGRGQAPTVDPTAPPSGGAAGRGQAPTVDRTAPPSGGAAGRGQAPTVDPTAPPSGGAAGRGQAPTVDPTAPPSGGAAGRGQAPTVDAIWYIDPLDGTTNFAQGLPFFCVSVGRVTAGRPDLGVVVAPILGLTFTATRGGGAFCNGERLRVSDVTTLERAMLGTGFPSDRQTSADNNFAQFLAIKQRVRAVRRFGSSALDQALVAAGTFDGFWEMKLKPWDLAAGSLLVEEAGGRATGWLGEPLRLERGAVFASNGKIHDQILALLASAGIPDSAR